MLNMEDYRLSSYTIFVRLEDADGKYMLVHGYTGAIDVVSEKISNYLNSNTIFSEENIPFSKKIFDTLVSRGYITMKKSKEEFEYVSKLASVLHKTVKASLANFMFVVAYDCNFRCPYCFENGLSDKGRQWSKKTFTKDMVDKAYDAMLKIEKNRALHVNPITLYGGEPLLYENREIVEYIITKGRSLGYRFEAITNGYDLDHFEDLLGPDMIYRLQVTIDGIKENHNKKRIHYKDPNSFDRIVKNVKMALAKEVQVAIRVNTDKSNFDDIAVIEDLFKGDMKSTGSQVYSALLCNYDTEKKTSKIANFFDRKQFNQMHKNNNFKHKCQGIRITYLKLLEAIKGNKKMYFSSIGCGAQSGMYILDPFGEIYGCWDHIGDCRQVMGTYHDDMIKWTSIYYKWKNKNIGNTLKCRECKYAFYCHGGCPAKALFHNKDINIPFCDDFQNTFELSINRLYQNHIKQN